MNLNSTSNALSSKQKRSKVLGDYIIQETLGKGTFGKVKLGIYTPTQDKVAVKILEKSKLKDKDDYDRVNREMDIIKHFNHENVIQVYEILEDQEKFYIVTEYCEEGELFNYIVRKKRLNEDQAAYFFYQLINGLENIHSFSIAHRDLKPENLLLTHEKKIKIIDFGLSNFNHSDLLSTPCGSPCYASPEMVSGKKYDGFKIDVWSCGIILYAMVCGYLPFEDPDNEKLFMKILECNLTFPNYVSSLSKDMIKKILVTDPEKRIAVPEIKKHNFYFHGKSIYMREFSPGKKITFERLATEGNVRSNRVSALSLETDPGNISSNKEGHTTQNTQNTQITQITQINNNNIHQINQSLNFNNFISSSLSPKTRLNNKKKTEFVPNSNNPIYLHTNPNPSPNLHIRSPTNRFNTEKISSYKLSTSNYFNQTKSKTKTKNSPNSIVLQPKNDFVNIVDLNTPTYIGKNSINSTNTFKSTRKDPFFFSSLDFNFIPSFANNRVLSPQNIQPTKYKQINLYDSNNIITTQSKKSTSTNINNNPVINLNFKEISKNKYLPKIDKNILPSTTMNRHDRNDDKFNKLSKLNNHYLFTDTNDYAKLNEVSQNNFNHKSKLNEFLSTNPSTTKNRESNRKSFNFSKHSGVVSNINGNLNGNVNSIINGGSRITYPKNKIISTNLKIKEKVKDLYYKDYFSKIGVNS